MRCLEPRTNGHVPPLRCRGCPGSGRYVGHRMGEQRMCLEAYAARLTSCCAVAIPFMSQIYSRQQCLGARLTARLTCCAVVSSFAAHAPNIREKTYTTQQQRAAAAVVL